MKILLATDYYPPIRGGVSRHVYLLANALKERGHEVTVFTVGSGHIHETSIENGVRVVRLDGFFQRLPLLFKEPDVRHHPPFQDWLVTRAVERLVREEQPDLIHSHGWILNSVFPIKRKTKIPLIHTMHDYGLICPKKTLENATHGCFSICDSPLTRNCVRCAVESYGPYKSLLTFLGVRNTFRIMNEVDKFIAVSDYVKRVHLSRLPIAEDRIVVVPNFYKKEVINGEDTLELPEDFILFVGALFPSKGIEVLISAYKELSVVTKLVIMGFRVRPYCYKGTRNILIFENTPRKSILRAYSHARVVVVPSLWPETFCQVALEAMAFRRPIIASRTGGLTDLVQDEKTGLLVQPGNSEELKNAIRFLLENKVVAGKMGLEGYERYTRFFSEKQVLPSIERLYQDVITTTKRF